MDYLKEAKDFLKSTGTTFEAKFIKNDYHFDGDNLKRDIYRITLQRGNRKFNFDFGQSTMNSQYYLDKVTGDKFSEGKEYFETFERMRTKKVYKDKFFKFIYPMSVPMHSENLMKKAGVLKEGKAPTEYDILACLQKYDPETFEDFCANFGYDEDSRKAEKIYNAVVDEYKNVAMLWNDAEIQLLSEIE
jgi:hypothetical protein